MHEQTESAEQSGKRLAGRFAINEANLARRREFIRLGVEDRRLMSGLESWGNRVAADIRRQVLRFPVFVCAHAKLF